jgi:hypothetical protein
VSTKNAAHATAREADWPPLAFRISSHFGSGDIARVHRSGFFVEDYRVKRTAAMIAAIGKDVIKAATYRRKDESPSDTGDQKLARPLTAKPLGQPIAAYQSAPVLAITHAALVARTEPHGASRKFKLIFSEPGSGMRHRALCKDRATPPMNGCSRRGK